MQHLPNGLAKDLFQVLLPLKMGMIGISQIGHGLLIRKRGQNRRCNIHEFVQGCLLRKRPVATIYKCSQQEFDTYISALSEAGLINVVVDDGISYYYATPKSEEYTDRSKGELKKFIKSCLSTIIEVGAKGVTEVVIKHYPTESVLV